MPFCNTCRSIEKSWFVTCKGHCDSDCKNRCDKCNNLFDAIVVRPNQSYVATTEAQRARLAREMASLTRETGVAFEAKIEVVQYPDGSTAARQSIITRPDIWRNF